MWLVRRCVRQLLNFIRSASVDMSLNTDSCRDVLPALPALCVVQAFEQE